MLHRGPYTYGFTKKEAFFEYQEIKGGSEERGGSKANQTREFCGI